MKVSTTNFAPPDALVTTSRALVLTRPSHDLTRPSHDLTRPSRDLTHPSHDLPHPSHDLPRPSHDLPRPSHDLPQPSHELPRPIHDHQRPCTGHAHLIRLTRTHFPKIFPPRTLYSYQNPRILHPRPSHLNTCSPPSSAEKPLPNSNTMPRPAKPKAIIPPP